LAAAIASLASLAPTPYTLTAADPPAPTKGKETLVGGRPLFDGWPANKIPDAVIVFTGQSYGYLQPCGCSRPQTGGLERRAEFIESLKAKGWPVAGVDLGDLYPEKVVLAEQGQLKYIATMKALRDMGYLGVGVGKTELQGDLLALLSGYALQKDQRPFTLAGNAVGVGQGNPPMRFAREKYFPGDKRPMVEMIEVGEVGKVSVGVAGVVGTVLQQDNLKKKWAPNIDFTGEQQAIDDAAKALAKHKSKPQLKVLIYQGPNADAVKMATAFPQFQVILCRAAEGAPPLLAPIPVVGPKHAKGEQTLVVEVGEKGQHVGVLGAFKNGNRFDFKYQLVPLGEEYITPGADAVALANNKALQALDEYAKAVKDAKLLPQYRRKPHPAQIALADMKPPVKLTYVGTAQCAGCHAAEAAQWKATPHSNAMNTLENVAKRPNLRQFDGECVKCHSVGFDYDSGYVDNVKTPLLRDVGCESCHGPGSGHVNAPKNKDFLNLMSPWKPGGGAAGAAPVKLDLKLIEEMAKTDPLKRGEKPIPPAQQMVINKVTQTCMNCHDNEADPHFDFYKNWPKIAHTGLAPAVPPKQAPPK
jgi:hypothetical protein